MRVMLPQVPVPNFIAQVIRIQPVPVGTPINVSMQLYNASNSWLYFDIIEASNNLHTLYGTIMYRLYINLVFEGLQLV